MANPQLEDGYLKIARKIQDALCRTRIPGEIRQIVDVVIRQTYGYKRSSDDISLDHFCGMTGMKKPTVSRAIKGALEMNLIIKKDNEHRAPSTFKLNKNYEEWRSLSKKITLSKKIMSVIKKDNEPTLTLYSSKENTKENMPRLGKNSTANPEWLNGEVWEEWEKYRREIRKTLTPSTRKLQLKFLEANQKDQKDIINQSIQNGWTGLFPLKKGKEAKVPRVFK